MHLELHVNVTVHYTVECYRIWKYVTGHVTF